MNQVMDIWTNSYRLPDIQEQKCLISGQILTMISGFILAIIKAGYTLIHT